ncbi:MAG TPA: DegT/DnrJ/EryC1/StrS family aminotransferase [bacterium]|nr:DegT/DnrJ/EryC1/StrS family aminotransferase [bacterium]
MKKIELIDLAAQYRAYKDEFDAAIGTVCERAAFIMGSEVSELEQALAAHCGAPHCVSCANGTDALVLALRALDIGPGDEVITSTFSFIATAEAIATVGATPVFVDIEADTYLIDAAQIEKKITKKSRAIIPVSLYGQCPDIDAVNALAAKHNLTVIEDAAQSFGALYHGRKSCGLTRVATTSFFPAKPLGCYGDGGAVFTDDAAIAQKLASLRLHGQSKRYYHRLVGMNSRLDTVQAAVLLVKLAHFDDEIRQRQAVARRYDELLAKLPLVRPTVREGRLSVWAQYAIRVKDRDTVAQKLKDAGIATAVHYPLPLHLQEVFAPLGYREGSLPLAEEAARTVLSLPMSAFVTAEEQEQVADTLATAL